MCYGSFATLLLPLRRRPLNKKCCREKDGLEKLERVIISCFNVNWRYLLPRAPFPSEEATTAEFLVGKS